MCWACEAAVVGLITAQSTRKMRCAAGSVAVCRSKRISRFCTTMRRRPMRANPSSARSSPMGNPSPASITMACSMTSLTLRVRTVSLSTGARKREPFWASSDQSELI